MDTLLSGTTYRENMARKAKLFDFVAYLEKRNDFHLGHINNPIIDRILFDGDSEIPVAYGVVKRLAEAIILVNPDLPKITRARALRDLMAYAEYGTTSAGIDQLHCFVKDEKVAKLLERKFGFVRTKDIVLVKNY